MSLDLTAIRNLIIDMDGVLYRGQTGLPGGPELIAFLQARGLGYVLFTNNSTLRPADFARRLNGMGIAVGEERIITSGVATAEWLSTQAPAGARVLVIGENGIIAEMEKRGFQVVTGRACDYVVVGWDKTLTYEKLETACLAIRDGARFIGTNADTTYPLERDIIPGAGSNLAFLVAATDVQPTVVGKPETIAIEQCLRHMPDARRDNTAMLGDRLETDILGGHRAGLATIMVLTGISSAAEAAAYPTPPDLLLDDIPALLREWRAALGS
ncbi:MAG: HAD-IIA family hydrolase [Chloroflexota bacterium]